MNSNILAAVQKMGNLKKLTWALSKGNKASIILDDNDNTEQPEQWIPFQLGLEQNTAEQTRSQYLNKGDLIEKLKQVLPNTDVIVMEEKVMDSGLPFSYL